MPRGVRILVSLALMSLAASWLAAILVSEKKAWLIWMLNLLSPR